MNKDKLRSKIMSFTETITDSEGKQKKQKNHYVVYHNPAYRFKK